MDAAKIREKGEDSVDRKGGCDFVLRLFFFFSDYGRKDYDGPLGQGPRWTGEQY